MPLFSFLVLFVAAMGYLVFANTLFSACFNQLGKQDGGGRSHYSKLAVTVSVRKDPTGPTTLLQRVKEGEFDELPQDEMKYKGNFRNASPNTNMPECNFEVVLHVYCLRLWFSSEFLQNNLNWSENQTVYPL